MNRSLALVVVLALVLAGAVHTIQSPTPSYAQAQAPAIASDPFGASRDTAYREQPADDRTVEDRTAELTKLLHRIFPDEEIEIIPLPKGVVLKGNVKGIDQTGAMIQIANQFFPDVISLLRGPESRMGSEYTPLSQLALPRMSNPNVPQPPHPARMPESYPLPGRPGAGAPGPGIDGPAGGGTSGLPGTSVAPGLGPGLGGPGMLPGPAAIPGMPGAPGMLPPNGGAPPMGPAGHLPHMGRELAELREEIQQLRREVRELRELLERREPEPGTRAATPPGNRSTSIPRLSNTPPQPDTSDRETTAPDTRLEPSELSP